MVLDIGIVLAYLAAVGLVWWMLSVAHSLRDIAEALERDSSDVQSRPGFAAHGVLISSDNEPTQQLQPIAVSPPEEWTCEHPFCPLCEVGGGD